MDYRQFTDPILKATQVQAPASSAPNLSDSFRGSFMASALAPAARAQTVAVESQADEEEKRRQAAAQARIAALQDSMDPNKFERVRKDDGGFDFFDPSGKKIDVSVFAQRTGKRKIDVLSDSENPLDQQFISDYDTMSKINQAVWSNDSIDLEDFGQKYPNLFSGKSPTPQDLNKKLLEKYPHLFGLGNYNKSASNLGNPIFRQGGSGGATRQGGSGRSGLRL